MKQSLYWRPLLVLAVVCTLALVACEEEEEPGDRGGYSFSGFVTDSVTSTPIDSAKVSYFDTLLAPFWYSDSTGYYTAASFGSRVTVFVQKAGYVTKSRELELTGNPTDVDFELVPIP